MEKPLNVRLHIVSPVHIGCDDVYEPTSFVIDEKKGKLIVFDPIDFIKSLSPEDRQRFTALCMQGTISSIVGIYKFISGRQVKGREVEIASELSSHYKKVRDLPQNAEGRVRQELNKFAISRTAYNPHNNLPYIPGSSLKGSFRTAYLSKLAKDRGIKDGKDRKDRAKELEEELLGGNFATDPFRMVKVSDFMPVGDVKTKIVYAVNKKKKISKFEARGPFQILEIIKEGSVFEGIINIQKPEQKTGIKNPIEIKEFLKSINRFFMSEANKESGTTKEIGAGTIVDMRINEQFKDWLGKTVFLVRIGRHSGAESVTIEGNRFIKIMQGREQPSKFLDHATTIWLASETSKPNTSNGLVPFGWAVLELLPFDIENIYPLSFVMERSEPKETETKVLNTAVKPVSQNLKPEPILWENAYLIWNPGNATLTATKDNKKAEIRLGSDRAIVPETLHKKLFEKRKGVGATVTVAPVGNTFKIIKIEPTTG